MRNEPHITLTAANDNPGGPTAVSVPLVNFVTVIAKAYVAETAAKAVQSA